MIQELPKTSVTAMDTMLVLFLKKNNTTNMNMIYSKKILYCHVFINSYKSLNTTDMLRNKKKPSFLRAYKSSLFGGGN